MMREPSCSSAIAEPSAIDRWEPLFDSLSTPLGFVAGDANVRRITGNDPINFMDPTGEIPVHGNDGYWHQTADPKSPRGPQFTGKGYWHSDVPGAGPVKYVKGVADFSPYMVKYQGKTLTVQIPAQGVSSEDIRKANDLVRSTPTLEAFPGAKALGATWHHKRFNRATGMMTLELVEKTVHDAADHTGGFAQYLDWAAEVTEAGSAGKVGNELGAALNRTLRRGSLSGRVKGRLITEGIDATDRLIASALAQSGKYAGKAGSARLLGTVIRRAPGVLAAVSAVWAAGSAYGSTGDLGEVKRAVARELAQADLIEGAVQITYVRGANIVGDSLIDEQGPLRRRNLPDDIRQEQQSILRQRYNREYAFQVEEQKPKSDEERARAMIDSFLDLWRSK
jgi:hypothetical protein